MDGYILYDIYIYVYMSYICITCQSWWVVQIYKKIYNIKRWFENRKSC